MKVAINAGHCPDINPRTGYMYDSGAVGEKHTEAELVRDIAKVVCESLENVGYETLFIQENRISDICNLSNEFEADVFCSIHMNACNHYAQGTETYFYYNSAKGYQLAKCVQHQMLLEMHSVNRGIKEYGYDVIHYTECPACLAEIDFIDFVEREEYMASHIEEIGKSIARGITDYFESMGD